MNMQRTLLFYCLFSGCTLAMQSGRLQGLRGSAGGACVEAETSASRLAFWDPMGAMGGLAMSGADWGCASSDAVSGENMHDVPRVTFYDELNAFCAFVQSCGSVCTLEPGVLRAMIDALEALKCKPSFMGQHHEMMNGVRFLHGLLYDLFAFKQASSDNVMSNAAARMALKRYGAIMRLMARLREVKNIEDKCVRSFAVVFDQPVAARDVCTLLLGAMRDLRTISRMQRLGLSSSEVTSMAAYFAEVFNRVFAEHITSMQAILEEVC